jgi:hypothetical protein
MLPFLVDLDCRPTLTPQEVARGLEIAGLGLKHLAADVATELDVALLFIHCHRTLALSARVALINSSVKRIAL